jgi:hypothetical protein
MSEDSASYEATIARPTSSARHWRRWRWPVLVALALLAFLYYRGWSTELLSFSDGRSFDVLNYDRHVSYTILRDGSRTSERMFWVRYYSNVDGEASLDEARQLAPNLFPVAESLGYTILRLDPSHPLFRRHFPLAVLSYRLRFERDTSGHWHEVKP